MKKRIKDYVFLFGLAGVVVALDQVTKTIVRTNLALGETWMPWKWLAPYARFVNWKNTGAAFGIGQGLGDIIAILAIIVILLIIYYFPQVPHEDWSLRIAMGLQLGGALGNLIDRIVHGFVTDFISVGTFAVFNIADSSISIGVAVLLIGMWFNEHRKEGEKTGQDASTENDPILVVKDKPSD
ncbi:MAG TPA: signal peptidase II [Anaerolineae bacterium]|nr:signal peptidase II [Anaerolineae bacterium]